MFPFPPRAYTPRHGYAGTNRPRGRTHIPPPLYYPWGYPGGFPYPGGYDGGHAGGYGDEYGRSYRGGYPGRHHFNPGFGQRPPQPRARMPGYDVVKVLSPGGMSDAITVVKSQRSGKVFVEKLIRVHNNFTASRTRAELRTLESVRNASPNLNQLQEYQWGPNMSELTLLLEYCDMGTLEDDIICNCKYSKLFSEASLWHIMLGVGSALAYMHEGIQNATVANLQRPRGWNMTCHLDLKPGNVFLSSRGSNGRFPRVVLGDFGASVSKSDVTEGHEHPTLQSAGTPSWYPPEGVVGMRYGPETDIWQLGAMMHVMCRLLTAPDRLILKNTNPAGCSYSKEMNVAIEYLTHRNWHKRPTAAELVRAIALEGWAEMT